VAARRWPAVCRSLERIEQRLLSYLGRLLRTSRGWYPGGLRKVEEDLGIRNASKGTDLGPWVLIRHDSDGRLLSYKQL